MKHNIDNSFATRLEEREQVRDLLVEAGARAPVPEEDLNAIKRSATANWMDLAESRRSRKNRSRIAVTLAAAVGLAAVALLTFWRSEVILPGPVQVASIGYVTGEAMISHQQVAGVERAVSGMPLVDGDRVSTGQRSGEESAESASRAAMTLASGHSARIDVDTEVTVLGDNRLRLHRGAIYLDSGSSGSDALEVVTDWGVVRDIGTQFEVRVLKASDAVRVRVREGEVVMESGAALQTLAPGEEIEVAGSGAIVRRSVPKFGAGWDWILATAEAPDMEGQPVGVFLEWFVRESGHTLHYNDAWVASAASKVEMFGPVAGMRPFEALDSVVASSGMDYEFRGSELVITGSEH